MLFRLDLDVIKTNGTGLETWLQGAQGDWRFCAKHSRFPRVDVKPGIAQNVVHSAAFGQLLKPWGRRWQCRWFSAGFIVESGGREGRRGSRTNIASYCGEGKLKKQASTFDLSKPTIVPMIWPVSYAVCGWQQSGSFLSLAYN